ncbi:UNVERIFIED_CONTAM: hypothetical protein RMT77_006433 [Armadillidium vulgare]
MVWCELQRHSNDYYFCSVEVKGFNSKSKNEITYPNVNSTILSVLRSSEMPVPLPPYNLNDIRLESEGEVNAVPTQEDSGSEFSVHEGPQLFSQSELKDLFRDLGLSKDPAEFELKTQE